MSGIVYFREIILEGSHNVSETIPRLLMTFIAGVTSSRIACHR